MTSFSQPMFDPITVEDFAPHASFNEFSYVPGPNKKKPTFWGDLVPSVLSRETMGGSILAAFDAEESYPPDPRFKAHEFLGVQEGFGVKDVAQRLQMTERAAMSLMQTKSLPEFHAVASRIAKEKDAYDVQGQFSFWSNLAAGIVTLPFDPLTYIPIGGAGVKAFELGRSGFKAAAKHFVTKEMFKVGAHEIGRAHV